MRVPTYLHRNSFDIYYFRIAVPLRFRQYFGRRELKKSLRTTSFSVAVRRAQIMAGKVFELFENGSAMIDDEWLKISSKWNAKIFSIDFGNGKRLEAENLTVDPEIPGDVQGFNETINTLAGKVIVEHTEQPAKSFTDLFEEYLVVRRQKKAKFRDATEKDYRKKVSLFIEILGDRPINFYNHLDADELQRTLQKLPKNRNKSPKYREIKTVGDAIKLNIPKSDLIADKTINTFLTVISGIFRLGFTRGYLKVNPFAEKQLLLEKSPDEEWIPFNDEDLRKIFDPQFFQPNKRYPSRYFCCLLAVYTGARMNEICQITPDNVTEHCGYFCVRFTDGGENQQLKGRNSNRTVPLHSKIIELGFLDYVKSRPQNSMLFPDLIQSDDGKWNRRLRSWFNDRYLPKIGVKREKISFRSFRRSFATKLRNIGVQETFVAEILGHAKGKGTYLTWKTYASRGETPPLIEAIEKIQFEWASALKPWK